MKFKIGDKVIYHHDGMPNGHFIKSGSIGVVKGIPGDYDPIYEYQIEFDSKSFSLDVFEDPHTTTVKLANMKPHRGEKLNLI